MKNVQYALNNIHMASVDICTKCQLKCISCSTSKGIIRNGFIKEGKMTFELFKHFIDNNAKIKKVELSNWGEIFLNDDIISIMRYAYENNVELYCANGANFNWVPENVLEALVKFKFKCLNISIDGASQETYEQYRVHGSITNVIANIKKLNFYKSLYNSDYPKLSWQFIIFGHNEHEITTVKALCKELNMVFNPRLNHSDFSPIKDEEKVKSETGLDYASRKEYKEKHKTEYKHPCYQCIYSPQINWNGEVLGCCVNKWKGLGNIFDHTLQEIVAARPYQLMLNVLLGKQEPDDSIPCYYCPNLDIIREHPINEVGLTKYKEYVPPALR